jgi:hypothetical protein
MNESDIKAKLDQLADFQAQRDLIDADKRALLDEVKIPDEVLTIQRAGNDQQDEIERKAVIDSKKINSDIENRLSKIVIPEEVKVILAQIDEQRAAVRAEGAKRENEIRVQSNLEKQSIREATEAQTVDIYRAIAQRKAEIEAEFSGKAESVDENIRKLTEDIKAEVKELGASVKSDYFHAIYVKGRVTWDTSKMDGYAVGHPEVLFMRKEGEPSVSIRTAK